MFLFSIHLSLFLFLKPPPTIPFTLSSSYCFFLVFNTSFSLSLRFFSILLFIVFQVYCQVHLSFLNSLLYPPGLLALLFFFLLRLQFAPSQFPSYSTSSLSLSSSLSSSSSFYLIFSVLLFFFCRILVFSRHCTRLPFAATAFCFSSHL